MLFHRSVIGGNLEIGMPALTNIPIFPDIPSNWVLNLDQFISEAPKFAIFTSTPDAVTLSSLLFLRATASDPSGMIGSLAQAACVGGQVEWGIHFVFHRLEQVVNAV